MLSYQEAELPLILLLWSVSGRFASRLCKVRFLRIAAIGSSHSIGQNGLNAAIRRILASDRNADKPAVGRSADYALIWAANQNLNLTPRTGPC